MPVELEIGKIVPIQENTVISKFPVLMYLAKKSPSGTTLMFNVIPAGANIACINCASWALVGTPEGMVMEIFNSSPAAFLRGLPFQPAAFNMVLTLCRFWVP